jgi:23S rRNA (uridine2552-2'-O)-methyltransferase
MARSKSSNAWLHEHVTDAYVKRAQREGYRSRAAYKLMEIDDRDKLLRPGTLAVDLGAAPGGWSQVAAQRLGRGGRVVAVDLLDMTPIAGVDFVRGDFSEPQTREKLAALTGDRRIDLVLSDLSPNLSGIAQNDQARAYGLAEAALEFARGNLQPQGAFLVKLFQGADFDAFRKTMAITFMSITTRKPSASRERSPELYLLGRSLRP